MRCYVVTGTLEHQQVISRVIRAESKTDAKRAFLLLYPRLTFLSIVIV